MKLAGGAHGSAAGRVASGLSGRSAGGARGGLLGGRGQVCAGETGRVGERGRSGPRRGERAWGSLGRAGCEWSEGGLCHAGRLGHGREGEEQGWVDGWLWAGFQVGLGGFLFSFSFLILIQTQAKRIQINLNSNSNQTTKEEDAPA